MRRWFLKLLVTASLLLPLAATSAPPRTILVLGDSLSAAFGIDVGDGWVALLERRLAQKELNYRVVNASISGDTTANGLARLPPLLRQHQPDIVIVQLGGNDGLRGQSTAQMKHNIAAIVTKAKTHGAKVLLVGVPLPPNYGRQYIERFLQTYREVAAEQAVPLVPSIFDGITYDGTLVQPDGIHPTAQAQPRMLENVWFALRRVL